LARAEDLPEIQAAGDVDGDEMEHVFNLGVGMVAIVPADAVSRAIEVLAAEAVDAFEIGEVVAGHGRATVVRS